MYLQGKNRIEKKVYKKSRKWARMNLQDEGFRLKYFRAFGKAANQHNELSKVLIWTNFGKSTVFCLHIT